MAGHTGPYEVLFHTLSKLRKEQNITQQELAERLGKPQSFVSKYESGERKIDVIEFIEITKLLNLKPVEVLDSVCSYLELKKTSNKGKDKKSL